MASAAVAYPTRQPSPSRRKTHKPYQPATAASAPPPPPDAFYGHEETAKMCSRFITALFACPDLPPASSPPTPSTPLANFVAYALHRTRLPPSVTFCALFLLNRLKGRFPAARGSSGHRLFISAFMIASKVVCDDTYSNKSWTVVGQGMFSLKEINQMEREMCSYLEWILHVQAGELSDFEHRVKRDYSSAAPPPAPSAVPIPVNRPTVVVAPPSVPIASPPKPLRQSSSEVRAAAANNYPSPAGTPDLPAPAPSAAASAAASAAGQHPLQAVAHAASSSSSLSSTASTHVVSPPQDDSDIDSASSSPASSTCLSTPPQEDTDAAVPIAIAVAPAVTAPHPHHKRSLEGIPVDITHVSSNPGGRKPSHGKLEQQHGKPIRSQSSFGYAAPAIW